MKTLMLFFEEGSARKLQGGLNRLIAASAIMLSLFVMWSARYGNLDPLIYRAVFLSVIIAMAVILYNPNQRANDRVPWHDLLMAVVSIAFGAYFFVHAERITTRWALVDPLTAVDVTLGIVMILICLEVVRRTLGLGLTLIIIMFLAYTLGGHLIQGTFGHRYIDMNMMVDQFVFTVNGFFSSPIAVASTYVFLFVLFGAFLQESGAADFFFKFTSALAGRSAGGPAKIGVLSSAFLGTINGSPTANVVTTGAFTIPMMKRLGYPANYAGAVESVASTGGSILPPVMGAAVFLMAEMTGISYGQIVIAAILPALLYYGALLCMVHFKAKRTGMKGLPEEEVPALGATLKEGFHHFLPLGILVALLVMGRSPSYVAVLSILSIVVISWFRKENRMGWRSILRALESGGRMAVLVSAACAGAGLVIGGITVTGLGGKFSSLVLGFSGGQIFFALALTAIICIILGMGMPVSAAYVLTAVLAVPALIEMGISMMAAHLFVVYFSVLSAITPPVAVAAYAAAGIAQGSPWNIGWTSVRLGIMGFIIPFMFVYQPALLLMASPQEVIMAVLTSAIGTIALSAGIEGWLYSNVPPILRVLYILSGLIMIYPGWGTDVIGLAVFVAGAVYLRKSRTNQSIIHSEVTQSQAN
ncbi:TRAP transporter permease [Ammoniphilus sp. YIM 78166]|uniref:TRAP transporter permease n=1 Tax=Ammoniphilus sp. YIM 78166 TaxID=1644106 RepID=UPI00106FBEAD|nr:TRAP transporter permease [Ammoniphilus sp. YIM 78166]